MLPTSTFIGEIPGLAEQAEVWLEDLPSRRARVERQARALAAPALHPAGISRLVSVAGRLIGQAAVWATVDLGRATYRAAVYGERDDARLTSAVARAEELVRDFGPVYVKLGQFISTAKGLLSDEVVDA